MPTPNTSDRVEPYTPNAAQYARPLSPAETAEPFGKVLFSGLDPECQFVYGEDQTDFTVLQREYVARFQPRSPEERFQVDTLLRNEWNLRRLFRAEAQLWEYHAICSDRSSGVPLGEGFDRASAVFMRMQRRVAASEQSYKDAFKELTRLQAMRTADSARLPQREPPSVTPPVKEQTFAAASGVTSQPEQAATPVEPLNDPQPASPEKPALDHKLAAGAASGREHAVPSS